MMARAHPIPSFRAASRLHLIGAIVASVLLSVSVTFGLVPRAHAFGCQASGSLPIFPGAAPGFTHSGTTCPQALQTGDNIDILITLTNTSSSVPPGTFVTAKLLNTCVGASVGTPCTADTDCVGGGPCAAA